MAKKGRPFGSGLLYSDPVDHARHLAFLKHRSQCRFRQEPYELSIEDFFLLWPPHAWCLRGKKATDLCMIRVNRDRPWCLDNCVLVTRYQQLTRDRTALKFPDEKLDI